MIGACVVRAGTGVERILAVVEGIAFVVFGMGKEFTFICTKGGLG